MTTDIDGSGDGKGSTDGCVPAGRLYSEHEAPIGSHAVLAAKGAIARQSDTA